MASVADNLASKKPWNSLSNAERQAAEDAGYNRASWTAQIGPQQQPQGNSSPPPQGTLFQKLDKLAQDRMPKTETTAGDLEAMANAIKSIRQGTMDVEGNMDAILNMLALEDTLRVDISKTLGMSLLPTNIRCPGRLHLLIFSITDLPFKSYLRKILID